MSWFKAERAYMGPLQNGLSITLAWGAVPFTIGLMGYDYLAAHELGTTLFHAGLVAASATFGLWSYIRSTRTLRASGGELSLPWIASGAMREAAVAIGVFVMVDPISVENSPRLGSFGSRVRQHGDTLIRLPRKTLSARKSA